MTVGQSQERWHRQVRGAGVHLKDVAGGADTRGKGRGVQRSCEARGTGTRPQGLGRRETGKVVGTVGVVPGAAASGTL